jgi:hypothetical protein
MYKLAHRVHGSWPQFPDCQIPYIQWSEIFMIREGDEFSLTAFHLTTSGVVIQLSLHTQPAMQTPAQPVCMKYTLMRVAKMGVARYSPLV